MSDETFQVRPAITADIPAILALIQPLVDRRILLGKEPVQLYEAVPKLRVAVDVDGTLLGCGAIHVMWTDLGEVRTLAVDSRARGRGVGGAILDSIEAWARDLGLSRMFCLTFETKFFESHGYVRVGEHVVDRDVYAELLRSNDVGVAEFLDLAHVKPNTLGNTRMLKQL